MRGVVRPPGGAARRSISHDDRGAGPDRDRDLLQRVVVLHEANPLSVRRCHQRMDDAVESAVTASSASRERSGSRGRQDSHSTFYHNALDTRYPFVQREIFFFDSRSPTGTVVRNNIAAPSGGIEAINSAGAAIVQNKLWIGAMGQPHLFKAPFAANPDFTLTPAESTAIDRASSEGAPANDIGFDPRCIKQQGGQAVSFWQHAIDYEYIASIGGVATCFHPGKRPEGAAPISARTSEEALPVARPPPIVMMAIGARRTCAEARAARVAATAWTTTPAPPTAAIWPRVNASRIGSRAAAPPTINMRAPRPLQGSCDAARNLCTNQPVAGCCKFAADCDDKKPCTTDACAPGTGACSNTLISAAANRTAIAQTRMSAPPNDAIQRTEFALGRGSARAPATAHRAAYRIWEEHRVREPARAARK